MTLPFWSCESYSEYVIVGALSVPALVRRMNAIGIRMRRIQKESVFDSFPQSRSFLGGSGGMEGIYWKLTMLGRCRKFSAWSRP